MAGPFDYRLFGLNIRSDIELPELPASANGEPQVRIRLSDVDEGEQSLTIAGVVRFEVVEGSEIRVAPIAGAAERNIRLYLLGSAMGMLLHQRSLLPLHANAIEVGGRAVAFMGPSGSGKSTLAAWFHDHGYRVLADDVCVLRLDDGCVPVVVPGMARLRLWKDVLQASGKEPETFERSYAGAEDWEKYDVPLDRELETADRPLAGVYLLQGGEAFAVTRLEGLATAEALFANTYRGLFVPRSGNAVGHWDACVKIAGRTPIFALQRGWDLGRLDEQAGQILAHVHSQLGEG